MPTYDYVCSACGHEIEVVHGVHGHGPSHCPVCGATMRKSFATPTIHFKGSGWAKKERGASNRAGSGSASPTSKGETSGESTESTGSPGATGSTGTPDGGPPEGGHASPSGAGSSTSATD